MGSIRQLKTDIFLVGASPSVFNSLDIMLNLINKSFGGKEHKITPPKPND